MAGASALAGAVERTEASSSELAELRLLHLVQAGLVDLTDEERAEVVRLLVGRTASPSVSGSPGHRSEVLRVAVTARDRALAHQSGESRGRPPHRGGGGGGGEGLRGHPPAARRPQRPTLGRRDAAVHETPRPALRLDRGDDGSRSADQLLVEIAGLVAVPLALAVLMAEIAPATVNEVVGRAGVCIERGHAGAEVGRIVSGRARRFEGRGI